MKPIYFNPLDNTGNFIGTNPLSTSGVPIKTTLYPYFNPSIYNSFTFFTYPNTFLPQTLFQTTLLGTSLGASYKAIDGQSYSTVASNVIGNSTYYTVALFSTTNYYSTLFSTFQTNYATFYQLLPVTYSVRFGPELETLYASTDGATNYIATYENFFTQEFLYYSERIYTNNSGDSSLLSGLASSLISSGQFAASTFTQTPIPQPSGEYTVGSSSFVNLMGSNVYSGLMDTTNSIIIYQNEQVSSYYSQSLSYQVNIANLTAALNSVSGSGDDAKGKGSITITNFSWTWESTAQGWTGSQNTNFNGYLSSGVEVNYYLSVTYGGTTIGNSSVAVTQVQSLITVQNNDLANSQTFMNNAVTTLQSQVSLAGQIIGTLSSIMQSIINNI